MVFPFLFEIKIKGGAGFGVSLLIIYHPTLEYYAFWKKLWTITNYVVTGSETM